MFANITQKMLSLWDPLSSSPSCFASPLHSLLAALNRLARQSFSKGDVTRETVSARLLRNNSLNLWGLGATLLGLQVQIVL